MESLLNNQLIVLPDLPDKMGWAGMYGGVSKNILFCMGGANFPDGPPWDGGRKKWYDDIYLLQAGEWRMIGEKLPLPLAYGASVSYDDKIIVIGGNNHTGYFNVAFSCAWDGERMHFEDLPALPVSLAHMAGSVVKSMVVVAGGNCYPGGAAIRKCYALDMENISDGWFEMPDIPGEGRIDPVCAIYKNEFYLFSGITFGPDDGKEKIRRALNDGYKLSISRLETEWSGNWKALSRMPRGVAAAGNPLPVFENGKMLFWGGVDDESILHKDPPSHPGFSGNLLLYDAAFDTWSDREQVWDIDPRATLPVVYWNDWWIFISGEIRPGMRTNNVTGIAEIKYSLS